MYKHTNMKTELLKIWRAYKDINPKRNNKNKENGDKKLEVKNMTLKTLIQIISAMAYIVVIDSNKHICIYSGLNGDFKNACPLYLQYINHKIDFICDGMHDGEIDGHDYSNIEIYLD